MALELGVAEGLFLCGELWTGAKAGVQAVQTGRKTWKKASWSSVGWWSAITAFRAPRRLCGWYARQSTELQRVVTVGCRLWAVAFVLTQALVFVEEVLGLDDEVVG